MFSSCCPKLLQISQQLNTSQCTAKFKSQIPRDQLGGVTRHSAQGVKVSTEFLSGGSCKPLLLLGEFCALCGPLSSACQMGWLIFPVKQPIHWLPFYNHSENPLSKGSCDCVRATPQPLSPEVNSGGESGRRMAQISSGCCKTWCHQITHFTFSFLSPLAKCYHRLIFSR